MGKLEGENEYRYYVHKAQIYAKPNAMPKSDQYDEKHRLRFIEDAVNYYLDINPQLKPLMVIAD